MNICIQTIFIFFAETLQTFDLKLAAIVTRAEMHTSTKFEAFAAFWF